MKDYLIKRFNMPDVEFTGKEIAYINSRVPPTKPRWVEIAVYFTTKKKFVLVTTGKSSLAGEVDLVNVKTFDSAADLFDNLRRSGNGLEPSGPAKEILKQLHALASTKL